MGGFGRLLGCIVFALGMVLVFLSPLGDTLERRYGLGLLYALRGDIPAPPGVLIIGLDNRSVQWLNRNIHNLDQAAPMLDRCLDANDRRQLAGASNINHLPRGVYRCLIAALTRGHARLIVFDVNFNKPRPGDEKMAAAIARAGNVLLFERVIPPDKDTPIIQRRQPNRVLARNALGSMAFHVDSKRGQIATSYLTRFVGFPDLGPMPVKVWQEYTGQPPAQPLFQPLWFYGPPRTVPTIRLREAFDPGRLRLPDDLENRVVFIGASDPEDASIDDHFPVPTASMGENLMGGVELGATGFLNLLHRTPLIRAGLGVQCALVFTIALIAGGLAWFSRRFWLAAILVPVACYGVAAGAAFVAWRLWLPFGVPVLITAPVALILALGTRYVFARSLIGRLVPHQIAGALFSQSGPERGAAQMETASVMFTDLTGSTQMAEQMETLAYTRMMSAYYENATQIIESHKGMVIEFMGDGILALFTKRIIGPEYASHACLAASEMHRKFCNPAPGEMPLRLRVGISTGTVATGSMGAKKRYNYKALGDSVNIASRLERLGKRIKNNQDGVILLCDATRAVSAIAACNSEFIALLRLRGRQQKTKIYRLQLDKTAFTVLETDKEY